MFKSCGTVFTSFTSEQRRVFFTLSICYITMFCPDTLVPPFFPSEAGRHGVSSSLTGIVIGASAVVGLITSPFVGAIIAVSGPKKVIITGMVLNGVFSVLFGCLEDVESTHWFATGCFICTGFVSFGNATIYTATLVYAAKLFPDNFNLFAGMTELYIGIAEVIALLPGAVLHEFGGFKLPFIVFGFLHLLVIPLNLFLLPTDEEMMRDSVPTHDPSLSPTYENHVKPNPSEYINSIKMHSQNSMPIVSAPELNPSLLLKTKTQKIYQVSNETSKQMDNQIFVINSDQSKTNEVVVVSSKFNSRKKLPANLRLWHLLQIPRTMIMAFTFLMTSVCWSFINYTLEPHLAPLALTKTQTNLLFLITSVVYGISSPICGWVADHVRKTWKMCATGLVLTGLLFGFLGPLPFLGLENSVWLNVVCLILITIAINIAGIPAIEATLLYTIEAGHKENIGTYAIVSSLISMVNSAGLAIGSFTGGFLVEICSYPLSAGLYGAICLLSGGFVLGYFVTYHNQITPHMKKPHLPTEVSARKFQLQTSTATVASQTNHSYGPRQEDQQSFPPSA